jgi:hypothetical protein
MMVNKLLNNNNSELKSLLSKYFSESLLKTKDNSLLDSLYENSFKSVDTPSFSPSFITIDPIDPPKDNDDKDDKDEEEIDPITPPIIDDDSEDEVEVIIDPPIVDEPPVIIDPEPIEPDPVEPPEVDTPATFRMVHMDDTFKQDAQTVGYDDTIVVNSRNFGEENEFTNFTRSDGEKIYVIPVAFRATDEDVYSTDKKHLMVRRENIEIEGLDYDYNLTDHHGWEQLVSEDNEVKLNHPELEGFDITTSDSFILVPEYVINNINSKADGEVSMTLNLTAEDEFGQVTESQEFTILFNHSKEQAAEHLNMNAEDLDDNLLFSEGMPNKPEGGKSINVEIEDGAGSGSVDVDIEDDDKNGDGEVDVIFDGDGGSVVEESLDSDNSNSSALSAIDKLTESLSKENIEKSVGMLKNSGIIDESTEIDIDAIESKITDALDTLNNLVKNISYTIDMLKNLLEQNSNSNEELVQYEELFNFDIDGESKELTFEESFESLINTGNSSNTISPQNNVGEEFPIPDCTEGLYMCDLEDYEII